MKSFCGCFTVQGAVFSKRAPWPPEAFLQEAQLSMSSLESVRRIIDPVVEFFF
jgi:hypothetical protein